MNDTMIERLKSEENKRKKQIEIGNKMREMIDSGYSNREIGEALGLAESAVRSIRAKHFNK